MLLSFSIMNTEKINKVTQKFYKTENVEEFRVGDTIEVVTIIRDGDKQRKQIFKGLVIAIKGSGLGKTFTVRKISYGVGVEKIFPIHSPNVASVKVIKHGKPRRSKLYFMRERVGKLALKVKPGNAHTQENLIKAPKVEAKAEAEVSAEAETAEDTKAEAAESAK